MNIFVLTTGRSGSSSFIRACSHITNYTSSHESRSGDLGPERLNYPPNHIEADNRLSWFLGRLNSEYGDSAYYVHLIRDRISTANSFLKRFGTGIIGAYANSIHWKVNKTVSPLEICVDYVDTVNENIKSFLLGKSKKQTVDLSNITEDFERFWKNIGAEGDLQAALHEWQSPTNTTAEASVLQKLRSKIAIVKWTLRK